MSILCINGLNLILLYYLLSSCKRNCLIPIMTLNIKKVRRIIRIHLALLFT